MKASASEPGTLFCAVTVSPSAQALLFTKSIAVSCALPPFVGLNRNRITTLLSIL